MVQLIKTSVKCYKKKAKKMVGGKQKVYEYNQYLISLKRSDNFECGEGVLIIPEKYFKELFEAEDTWAVKEYLSKLKGYEMNIEEYQKKFQELELELQKDFKDLEWKHNELSRSYKELFSRHTKATKQYKLEGARFEELEAKNEELVRQLESRELEYKKLKEDYEMESNKATILENELKPDKDNDFWSMLKNRISKKELASREDK